MRYLAVESSVTKQNMVASIQVMPTTWLSVGLAAGVESVKVQGEPVRCGGLSTAISRSRGGSVQGGEVRRENERRSVTPRPPMAAQYAR